MELSEVQDHFTPEDMREASYGLVDKTFETESGLGLSVVEENLFDERRWVSVHEIIFTTSPDDYFGFLIERPLTEYQEGSETEPDPKDIYRVKPVEKTVTVYEKVKD